MDKKLATLDRTEDKDEVYPLAWPLYPIETIQTYFGDENFEKQYGIPHIGIQIEAIQ